MKTPNLQKIREMQSKLRERKTEDDGAVAAPTSASAAPASPLRPGEGGAPIARQDQDGEGSSEARGGSGPVRSNSRYNGINSARKSQGEVGASPEPKIESNGQDMVLKGSGSIRYVPIVTGLGIEQKLFVVTTETFGECRQRHRIHGTPL